MAWSPEETMPLVTLKNTKEKELTWIDGLYRLHN